MLGTIQKMSAALLAGDWIPLSGDRKAEPLPRNITEPFSKL